MTITDVRVRHIFEDNDISRLRAVVSITLDNMIAVHDIRIIAKGEKLYVSMPSTVNKDGRRRDVVHPIDSQTRAMVEDAVISAYKKALKETLDGINATYQKALEEADSTEA